jgi:hypothetical protein
MSRKVLARICWISPADGGREHPPTGRRYSTVARFEKEAKNWPKQAWSIVAEFVDGSDDSSGVLAELRFLAPSAPSHLLKPGNRFDLFEGHRLVAHGEVLETCVNQTIEQESLRVTKS